MLVQASPAQSGSAHVIVLGNEKGGSGKSTTAFHVAVALLKAGQRVATIDLDARQKSLTHYVENRAAWARRTGLQLELPHNIHVALGIGFGHVEPGDHRHYHDHPIGRCKANQRCEGHSLAQCERLKPFLELLGKKNPDSKYLIVMENIAKFQW